MLHTDIDAILSLLWTITYALVFCGTSKYEYPLISPIAQAVIAPLEFAVLIRLAASGMAGFNHVFINYVLWTILEIAIVIIQIRRGFIGKRYIALYVFCLVAATCVMCYLVVYRGYQLFFCLFNTFVGEIFWLLHVLKKSYPMNPMVLTLFLTKYVADVMSVVVYFGQGAWVNSLLGVLLPILDFVFIHIYFQRRAAEARAE